MLAKSIIFCFILSCIVGTVSAQKWGKITDEEWALTAPQDYPEANAVIIFAKAHLNVSLDNIEINYHIRMKAFTTDGVEEIGDRAISYHKKYDKIKRFKAHTITPDGKKHEVKKDAIFQKEIGSYREKTFTFPAMEPDCIIEYRFSNISERLHHLKPWFFQNEVYTMYSEFAVSFANGFVYNVSYQNVPVLNRQAKVEEMMDVDSYLISGGKIRTFTWTMENLPPIKDEPYMSAINDYRSSLRFQLVSFENPYNFIKYVEGWDKMGENFQKWWIDDYCNKKNDVKKMAEEVTAGLTSQREISMAIHKHVSEQFKTSRDYLNRYYMREKMDGLLTEKIGSPEEKNILMVEMHMAVGIPCWPVAISRRSHGKFAPNNPDLQQFDYIIAVTQLDDGWIFLDASSHLSPYGIIPPSCLTYAGLLINGKQSELVNIVVKSIQSYRADITRMFVSSDGTVVCSTECRYSGYKASQYGRRYERNEPDEFVEKYYLERLPVDYVLDDFNCELDSLSQFHMTLNYSADELAEQLDNNWIIKPVRYAYQTNPFESEKRLIPVDFQYPFVYHSIVEIHTDFAVEQSMLPENMAKEINGAKFTRVSVMSDSCIVVAHKLEITEPEFKVRRYQALRDIFDLVARTSEDEVTLVLKE